MKKSETQKRFSIPKHHHCPVCKTPISMNKEFCGEECEKVYNWNLKKKKERFYSILFLSVAIYVVSILLVIILKR